MRRDYDLVRDILKTCADAPGQVDASVFVTPQHPFEEIAYHYEIMKEANLVKAGIIFSWDGEPVHATIHSITWAGNDFLDVIRSDDIWAKTKQRIAATGDTAPFDIVKTIATKLASEAIGL